MASPEFSIGVDFKKIDRKFTAIATTRMPELARNAVNNMAFAARKEVQAKIRTSFRDPKPFTTNAILVDRAEPNADISRIFATVRVKDDYPKAAAQPTQYLLAEVLGDDRHKKRSERAMGYAGLLASGQFEVPASGAPKDAYGQFPGQQMVVLLSRIGAFGESGFSANAAQKTKNKLKRQKLVASRVTDTDYFPARAKSGSGFIGVFQLTGPGKVKPVLWFTQAAPHYTKRFPFREIVRAAAAAACAASWKKAVEYLHRHPPSA